MLTYAKLVVWILALALQMHDTHGFNKAMPQPLASAIAEGAIAHPLGTAEVKTDDDVRRTAATLIVLAFREGSYRTDVVGDLNDPNGVSYGTFQTKQCAPYSCEALLKDARKQVDIYLFKLFGY